MSPAPIINAHNSTGDPSHDLTRESSLEGQSSQCDVLVIGAGPSGLMLAQALGRLGIHVRVIERRILGSQYGNADGLQPRTLEIWESYGILNKIRAKGACMRAMGSCFDTFQVAYEASADGKNLIRLRPWSNVVVPCRYQYEITASITDIEGTLRENAEESGVKITQPCWPTSLEVGQGIDASANASFPIKVMLEHPGQSTCICHTKNPDSKYIPNRCKCDAKQAVSRTEVVNAKFVVGADGASSWVRRSLGIEMQGEQTEDVWGVVDVLVDTDLPDYRFKCVIQAVSGAIIIIPREGDKIRIYVQLSVSDSIPRDADGKLDRSALQEEEILDKILSRVREGFFPYKITFTHVFWYTIFSTAQRVAERFSYQSRVLIAGDACHTHSPNAGQGANASMGDSHNLAWKLAYVLRGWADLSILRTYEIERRQYALDLISFDRNISQSLEGCPAADYQRSLHKQNMFTRCPLLDVVLVLVAYTDEDPISGIGITYATSPLTFQPPKGIGFIVPGERVLPCPVTRLGDWVDLDIHDLLISDGMFKLLVFPGDILRPNAKSNLLSFSETVSESIENLNPDPSLKRIHIHTVLRNRKEDVIWTDVQSSISPSWKTCFTVRSNEQDIYETFGLYAIDEAVTILVRPDGYISMVSQMSPESGQKIISFVFGLSNPL